MASVRELFDLVCELPETKWEHALRDTGADSATITRVLALLQANATASTRARQPLAGLLGQPVETELKSGDLLGAWRLERELGYGGMGSVFLAKRDDGHFSQQAAVKLIRGRADAVSTQRFAQERQVLANLQHSRIARLLDGGATPNGQPYLVMEYVDGKPITDWCRDNALGLNARLLLLQSVCEAVQFAHGRLIVHCDLKPSNVLVRSDGVPVLLDFGIARVIGPEPGSDTNTVSIDDASDSDSLSHTLMTPRYASPEQLRGEIPGIETDIYALGLMLYELACDEPPPRERDNWPPIPSVMAKPSVTWRRRLRGDIDAIVARACADSPEARYTSAAELANDLARLPRHEPLQARAGQRLYVAQRFLRRRWLPLTIATLVVMLASGFTWRTVLAERKAVQEADTAQRTAAFLVSVFASADSNVNKAEIASLSALDVLDNGRRRIQTELNDAPAVRAHLLEALGNAYRHQQANDIGAEMLAESVELYLSPEVDDPILAARANAALGNAMANGEFPGSATQAVAERSLMLTRATAKPQSQEMAYAWMILSLAYNRNGYYDKALRAAESSLALNEKLRGQPDNRLGPALHNMALILSNRGELDAAMDHIDRIIATNLPESTAIAANYSNKGKILRVQGKFTAAREYYEHALRIGVAHYGHGRGHAIFGLTNIGRLLVESGRYAEADGYLSRALSDQRQSAAVDSGEDLAIRQQQVYARVQSGRADAQEEAQSIYQRRTEVFGPDDLRSIGSLMLWAEAAMQDGNRDPAIHDAIDRGIAFWTERGQADRPSGLAIRSLLARWQLSQGDAAAAQATLSAIAPHRTRLFVLDALHLTRLEAWSARARHGPAAAIALDEEAFAQHRARMGDNHPHTALAALILARDLQASGDTERADALEQQWRPMLEQGFPSDSRYLTELPQA